MPINVLQIDILKALKEENSYVSLKDIMIKLSRHKLTARSFQNEIKSILNSQRGDTRGSASSTEYILEDIQRSYPSSKFLYVYKDSIIIGLFFKVNDIYRFYYDTDYLINYNVALPTLPLQVEPFDFNEIPPVFEDNLQEGINREIIEITHKEADEFELLALIEESIGDICFSKSKEECYIKGKKAHGYFNSLNEILSSNDKINILHGFKMHFSEADLFPENEDLSSLKSTRVEGISGYQYKKFIDIDFDNNKILSDKNANNYILKPYSKIKADPTTEHYYPHLAINEHLFMSFAKNELGFRVPYTALIKRETDKEFHYIIKRFDRLNGDRFAKATFATYLGLRSESKYKTTTEQMFKRIAKELISPIERMELLKHYFYSIMIVHEDMHTKNLSLILDEHKVLFAPLYDICSTPFYSSSKGYETHLTLNGKQKQIRPNDFKGVCKILNVDFKEFRAVCNDIALKYINVLPEYFYIIESLGSIPFYHTGYKKVKGDSEMRWYHKNQVEFVDILRSGHAKRKEELINLGWVKQTQ